MLRYQNWPGNSKFACKGHLMHGPDSMSCQLSQYLSTTGIVFYLAFLFHLTVGALFLTMIVLSREVDIFTGPFGTKLFSNS